MTGDTNNAIDKLKTYLLYQPEDPIAWSMLGQAYFEQGRNYQSALAALNKALELDVEYYPALLYRGLTYLEVNEGQLAVNDLFKARNLNRESFEASLGLGLGLFMTDRLDDTISQLTSSLSLAITDFDLAQVYYWRALAREAQGESRLASEDWQLLFTLEEGSVPEYWIKEADTSKTLTLIANLISTPVPRTPSPT
jgi:tetratricopeptide (TPR) repeat protein